MQQDVNDGDGEVRIPRHYWDAEFEVGRFYVPASVGPFDEASSGDDEEWPEFGPTPDAWHLLRCTLESVRNEIEVWTSPLWFT